jgi:hypothetical protein
MADPNGLTTTVASGPFVTIAPFGATGVAICVGGPNSAGANTGTSQVVLTLAEAEAIRTAMTAVITNQGGT